MEDMAGNLERLYEAGLVGRDLPPGYAEVVDGLPSGHIDVILDVAGRLDDVVPDERFEPIWGRRWWSVFMTF